MSRRACSIWREMRRSSAAALSKATEVVNLQVIVQQTLQRFSVSAAVSVVGARHQQCEIFLFALVACEVRMNALGKVAEKRLEAWRQVDLFRFVGFSEGGIVCFLRLLSRLLCSTPGGIRIIEIDLTLSDACFQLVELCIENSNHSQIAAFKRLELHANFGKFRFTLRQRSTHSRQLLAFVEQCIVVRGSLENNFGWHCGQLLV